MLKGISLRDLAARIEGERSLKHDLIADTRKLELQVQADGVTALHAEGHGSFPLRPLVHDQIGTRLKIPAKYYDRMLADQPALLATNVNTWFQAQPEKRLIRTLGGDARAFLSNRYQRIEHWEIAEVVLPILRDIPDVQIVSCELTERRMYIQAVAPRVTGEVRVGDVVQAGVIISNSEVGLGSVSVRTLIYRLSCLNGAVASDGTYRAAHIGRAIDDAEALWADDTRAAEDKTILLKVRDMVRQSVDQVRFNAILDKMTGLAERRIEGDPVGAVEVLAQKVGATEAERGGILRSLIEGGDLSAWGLLNAVTHQAHTSTSYDRAVEIEEAGGALLDLPRGEWTKILEAA